MKTLIIILSVISLFSCATIKELDKEMSPYAFKNISEIKHAYHLTDKQCERILKDAQSGKIASFWYDQRNQWCFNANIDYMQYKY